MQRSHTWTSSKTTEHLDCYLGGSHRIATYSVGASDTHGLLSSLFVVVVVMTGPSGTAYIGGQMSRRDREFHKTRIVLEHICDVNQITEVTLAFCCPFWAEQQ